MNTMLPNSLTSNLPRQHPIPAPSSPMQYRAIGLVRGYYQPLRTKMTRGILVTTDGRQIQAVLLGRIMSIIKKHLDLSQSHLWVVYPRTRPSDDQLQLQVVGIWEPETLKKDLENDQIASKSLPDGYFSIRGEVVFYSQTKEKVIVKIKQTPKTPSEKTKFFKLKLQGTLSEQPLYHFWDLEVKLIGTDLVIQEKTDLGRVPLTKKPIKKEPNLAEKTLLPKKTLARKKPQSPVHQALSKIFPKKI